MILFYKTAYMTQGQYIFEEYKYTSTILIFQLFALQIFLAKKVTHVPSFLHFQYCYLRIEIFALTTGLNRLITELNLG